MDRWVYCDVQREVKGDADALVCVVDRSAYFIRDVVCCSQIKHLKEVFEYAKQREYAFSRGEKPPTSPLSVDDNNYMRIIAALQPQMWEKIVEGNNDYQCALKEGVTKENCAECCRLYNLHKKLWCELDGDENPQKYGKPSHEYLLPKDKLRKVIEDNEMQQPELGSCEAGFPALRQYWELLSPEDQKLDVDSLVNNFVEDLKHIGAEIFAPNGEDKTKFQLVQNLNPLISERTIPVDRNLKVIEPGVSYLNLFDEAKIELTFSSYCEYEEEYKIPPVNDKDKKPLIYRLRTSLLQDQWRAFTVHDMSTYKVFAVGKRRIYCFPQLVRAGEDAIIPVDDIEKQDASKHADVYIKSSFLIDHYATACKESVIAGIEIKIESEMFVTPMD